MGEDDTIAAISTPLGEGGIGIVRVSGKDALQIADKIFVGSRKKSLEELPSHSLNYGRIIDPDSGQVIDEVLLSVMRAPRTYTREDIVEINCHGGIVPTKRVLELVLEKGARLAEPGEFTKRAFLNGRIDLSQAEAVMDLIRAQTDMGLAVAVNQLEGGLSKRVNSIRDILLEVLAHIEASIDFPEEDIEEMSIEEIKTRIVNAVKEIDKLLDTANTGKIIKEGLKTVIIGKPNVGKSSLLNALLQEKRAIVADIPGTTRDIIEEVINIKGIPLKIVDTAGIRETEDIVEKIGVERSREFFAKADLVLLVLDAADELTKEDIMIMELIGEKKTIILINKTDLPQKLDEERVMNMVGDKPVLKISVKENLGIEDLKDTITQIFFKGKLKSRDNTMITNIRHRDALKKAKENLVDAIKTIDAGMPLDCISIDIKEAWNRIGEITGETVKEDILNEIFRRFCIGK